MEPLAARNSHRFACTDPVRTSPRAANVGWAQHDAHEPVVVAIKGESLLNPIVCTTTGTPAPASDASLAACFYGSPLIPR